MNDSDIGHCIGLYSIGYMEDITSIQYIYAHAYDIVLGGGVDRGGPLT